MPYKIPTDERLSTAIRTVMRKNQQIKSQSELARLVKAELKKDDNDLRASAERIRRLGIEKGIFKMSIEYRDSDLKDMPMICPVCRNAMDPIMNMSLDGDMVEVKRKCSVCPYCVSGKVLSPGRYIFTRTSHEMSEDELMLRKLKKARTKIREASELITDALNMSDLKDRGEDAVERLEEIIGSKEVSCSIRNIIADLKQRDDERPVWTRSTVSPKNKDLKDI